MSALSIYHVDLIYEQYSLPVTVGVCAASKTDALRLAGERMAADGADRVVFIDCKRVCGKRLHDSWEAGTVLVY